VPTANLEEIFFPQICKSTSKEAFLWVRRMLYILFSTLISLVLTVLVYNLGYWVVIQESFFALWGHFWAIIEGFLGILFKNPFGNKFGLFVKSV